MRALPFDLLALDLDGTLLDAAGAPPPDLLPELRAWQRAGAHLAILTARAWVPDLLRGWPVDTVSRCYGAQLLQGGQVVHECTLETGAVAAALGCLAPAERRPDFGKTVLVTRHAALHHTDPAFEAAWPLAQGALKLIHGQPDPARMDALQAQWAALPGDQVIRERGDRLVLVAPGADKGGALHTLRTRLGVPLRRVLAVGDGPADAAMGPHAGQVVRVGAHPALASAHHTVPGPEALPALLRRWREARPEVLMGR